MITFIVRKPNISGRPDAAFLSKSNALLIDIEKYYLRNSCGNLYGL